jgi:hypothetical protein
VETAEINPKKAFEIDTRPSQQARTTNLILHDATSSSFGMSLWWDRFWLSIPRNLHWFIWYPIVVAILLMLLWQSGAKMLHNVKSTLVSLDLPLPTYKGAGYLNKEPAFYDSHQVHGVTPGFSVPFEAEFMGSSGFPRYTCKFNSAVVQAGGNMNDIETNITFISTSFTISRNIGHMSFAHKTNLVRLSLYSRLLSLCLTNQSCSKMQEGRSRNKSTALSLAK